MSYLVRALSIESGIQALRTPETAGIILPPELLPVSCQLTNFEDFSFEEAFTSSVFFDERTVNKEAPIGLKLSQAMTDISNVFGHVSKSLSSNHAAGMHSFLYQSADKTWNPGAEEFHKDNRGISWEHGEEKQTTLRGIFTIIGKTTETATNAEETEFASVESGALLIFKLKEPDGEPCTHKSLLHKGPNLAASELRFSMVMGG